MLSDEVYWALRYGGPHASVLDFDGMADRTILLDGWSKTYAMTGWRLGFGVFPAALVEPVTRLAINSVSCTSAFSQYGAIAALDGPQDGVAAMVAEFRRRRDVIVAGLNAIDGVSCVEPQGAFYAFPNITGTGLAADELAGRLLREAGRGGAGRHRVRPTWRGVSPDLLRQLGRQHRGGAGRDQVPTALLSWQLSDVTEGNRDRHGGRTFGRAGRKRRPIPHIKQLILRYMAIWSHLHVFASYTLASQLRAPSTATARAVTGSCRFTCGYDMNMRGQSDERPRHARKRAAASQPD